jgi:hypothetical protein
LEDRSDWEPCVCEADDGAHGADTEVRDFADTVSGAGHDTEGDTDDLSEDERSTGAASDSRDSDSASDTGSDSDTDGEIDSVSQGDTDRVSDPERETAQEDDENVIGAFAGSCRFESNGTAYCEDYVGDAYTRDDVLDACEGGVYAGFPCDTSGCQGVCLENVEDEDYQINRYVFESAEILEVACEGAGHEWDWTCLSEPPQSP